MLDNTGRPGEIEGLTVKKGTFIKTRIDYIYSLSSPGNEWFFTGSRQARRSSQAPVGFLMVGPPERARLLNPSQASQWIGKMCCFVFFPSPKYEPFRILFFLAEGKRVVNFQRILGETQPNSGRLCCSVDGKFQDCLRTEAWIFVHNWLFQGKDVNWS